MIPYLIYLSIISTASLFIGVSTALIFKVSFFASFGYTWFAILAVVIVDALTATLCRLLPGKCANPEKKVFNVSSKEKKFYEKLKIRKWKDLVPEIGQFTGFRKNQIVDPKSVEYLDRFLSEICYGAIGHVVSVFTGFLILWLFPSKGFWISIALSVAVVNALMNLPSLFILRYNSYKLKILRKNALKKQAQKDMLAEGATADA